MIEMIHKVLLWVHIPFGFLSLFLFWIPVGLKKGSALHKKIGWYYFITMWIVVITAIVMSLCNLLLGKYVAAAFLGYLGVITSYPLWYSYEILKQVKEWSTTYFLIRKVATSIIFISGVGMILMGVIKFQLAGIGIMMVFFGMLALPAAKEFLMNKEKAMRIEKKMKMHIQGTIISGIAAYTAFFAFGGRQFLIGVLQLDQKWMVIPWILPTLLGVVYMRFMQKKFRTI